MNDSTDGRATKSLFGDQVLQLGRDLWASPLANLELAVGELAGGSFDLVQMLPPLQSRRTVARPECAGHWQFDMLNGTRRISHMSHQRPRLSLSQDSS